MPLSKADVRCLVRTRILCKEWTGKRLSDSEIMAYGERDTSDAVWTRCLRAGLVRNTSRLPGVALTIKGKEALRRVGK